MSLYNLRDVVKQKTYFKSLKTLFLLSLAEVFKLVASFKRDSLIFTNLQSTVLKQYFLRRKPKVVNYMDYLKYRNNEFRAELDNDISNYDRNNIIEQIKGDLWRKAYTRQLWNALDLQISFWAIGQKCLEKNIKKQRNFWVNLLKKAKKKHFVNSMQKQPSRGVPKICSKFTVTATLLKSHFGMGVLL